MGIRTLLIEAKSTIDVKPVAEKALKLLPKRVGLVTTSQHKHKLNEIKKIIEKTGKKVFVGGQVLGCDASAAVKIKNKVDAFLYIGSGEFHPIEVVLETGKKVIIANPFSNEVSEINKKDVEIYKKRQKGALLKFLSSKNIGILVSTKPGQQKLRDAMKLKKKLEKKDKNCYIFIADNIDASQFENFPFVECWVNTACPRLEEDKSGIVNYKVIEGYIK